MAYRMRNDGQVDPAETVTPILQWQAAQRAV